MNRIGSAIVGAALAVFIPATAKAQTLKVTLLGTGSPILSMERFGPSTLVVAGQETLLFDCGRGASQRLWQLNVPLREIDAVFLTHFHSDHVVGLPDVWLTGWLPAAYGRRSEPFQVIGPIGTKDMMSNLEKAFSADVRIRISDERLPPRGVAITAGDIAEGVVYEKNGVKVTAFDVDHGDLIKPSLGYRLDYAGRSVVISGDTRFSENLIKHSQGVDVLIHEVAAAKDELFRSDEATRRIVSHHTTPQEAGMVFARVKPKLAVYSHFVFRGDPTFAPPTVADVLSLTRTAYQGPLEAGEDLMTIEIDDRVSVRRAAR